MHAVIGPQPPPQESPLLEKQALKKLEHNLVGQNSGPNMLSWGPKSLVSSCLFSSETNLGVKSLHFTSKADTEWVSFNSKWTTDCEKTLQESFNLSDHEGKIQYSYCAFTVKCYKFF